MQTSRSARELDYHSTLQFVLIRALIESTGAFLKRAGRVGVVDRALADQLSANCSALASDEALERGRHQVAHGAHSVQPAARWVAAVAEEGLWAAAACVIETPEGVRTMLESMRGAPLELHQTVRSDSARRTLHIVQEKLDEQLTPALVNAVQRTRP